VLESRDCCYIDASTYLVVVIIVIVVVILIIVLVVNVVFVAAAAAVAVVVVLIGAPPWCSGSVLDHISLSPVLESRRGHL